jgi:hypothetical protein
MDGLNAEDFQAIVNTDGLESRDEPYLMVPEITLPDAYNGVLRITSVIPEQVEIENPR